MSAAEKIEPRHQQIVMLQPGEWVLEKIAYQIWGFTKHQLYLYRKDGLMLEGIHYKRNPANRIVYCVDAVNKWMNGQ